MAGQVVQDLVTVFSADLAPLETAAARAQQIGQQIAAAATQASAAQTTAAQTGSAAQTTAGQQAAANYATQQAQMTADARANAQIRVTQARTEAEAEMQGYRAAVAEYAAAQQQETIAAREQSELRIIQARQEAQAQTQAGRNAAGGMDELFQTLGRGALVYYTVQQGVQILDAAVGHATQTWIDYQHVLVQTQNNTNETAQGARDMGTAIQGALGTIAEPLASLADGYRRTADFGYQGANANNIFAQSAKLAAATGADEGAITQLAAQTMHLYGIETTQTAAVLGVFMQGAQNSAQTLDQFGQSSQRAVALSASLHVPLDQAVAALSALTIGGYNAAQAQTGYIASLTHIINPTHAAVAEIQALQMQLEQTGQDAGIDLPKAFSAAGLAQYGYIGVLGMLREAYSRLHEGGQELSASQNALFQTFDGTVTPAMQAAGLSAADMTGETLKLVNAQRGGIPTAILTGSQWADLNRIYGQAADTLSGKLNPALEAEGRIAATTANKLELLKGAGTSIDTIFGPAFADTEVQLSKLGLIGKAAFQALSENNDDVVKSFAKVLSTIAQIDQAGKTAATGEAHLATAAEGLTTANTNLSAALDKVAQTAQANADAHAVLLATQTNGIASTGQHATAMQNATAAATAYHDALANLSTASTDYAAAQKAAAAEAAAALDKSFAEMQAAQLQHLADLDQRAIDSETQAGTDAASAFADSLMKQFGSKTPEIAAYEQQQLAAGDLGGFFQTTGGKYATEMLTGLTYGLAEQMGGATSQIAQDFVAGMQPILTDSKTLGGTVGLAYIDSLIAGIVSRDNDQQAALLQTLTEMRAIIAPAASAGAHTGNAQMDGILNAIHDKAPNLDAMLQYEVDRFGAAGTAIAAEGKKTGEAWYSEIAAALSLSLNEAADTAEAILGSQTAGRDAIASATAEYGGKNGYTGAVSQQEQNLMRQAELLRRRAASASTVSIADAQIAATIAGGAPPAVPDSQSTDQIVQSQVKGLTDLGRAVDDFSGKTPKLSAARQLIYDLLHDPKTEEGLLPYKDQLQSIYDLSGSGKLSPDAAAARVRAVLADAAKSSNPDVAGTAISIQQQLSATADRAATSAGTSAASKFYDAYAASLSTDAKGKNNKLASAMADLYAVTQLDPNTLSPGLRAALPDITKMYQAAMAGHPPDPGTLRADLKTWVAAGLDSDSPEVKFALQDAGAKMNDALQTSLDAPVKKGPRVPKGPKPPDFGTEAQTDMEQVLAREKQAISAIAQARTDLAAGKQATSIEDLLGIPIERLPPAVEQYRGAITTIVDLAKTHRISMQEEATRLDAVFAALLKSPDTNVALAAQAELEKSQAKIDAVVAKVDAATLRAQQGTESTLTKLYSGTEGKDFQPLSQLADILDLVGTADKANLPGVSTDLTNLATLLEGPGTVAPQKMRDAYVQAFKDMAASKDPYIHAIGVDGLAQLQTIDQQYIDEQRKTAATLMHDQETFGGKIGSLYQGTEKPDFQPISQLADVLDLVGQASADNLPKVATDLTDLSTLMEGPGTVAPQALRDAYIQAYTDMTKSSDKWIQAVGRDGLAQMQQYDAQQMDAANKLRDGVLQRLVSLPNDYTAPGADKKRGSFMATLLDDANAAGDAKMPEVQAKLLGWFDAVARGEKVSMADVTAYLNDQYNQRIAAGDRAGAVMLQQQRDNAQAAWEDEQKADARELKARQEANAQLITALRGQEGELLKARQPGAAPLNYADVAGQMEAESAEALAAGNTRLANSLHQRALLVAAGDKAALADLPAYFDRISREAGLAMTPGQEIAVAGWKRADDQIVIDAQKAIRAAETSLAQGLGGLGTALLDPKQSLTKDLSLVPALIQQAVAANMPDLAQQLRDDLAHAGQMGGAALEQQIMAALQRLAQEGPPEVAIFAQLAEQEIANAAALRPYQQAVDAATASQQRLDLALQGTQERLSDAQYALQQATTQEDKYTHAVLTGETAVRDQGRAFTYAERALQNQMDLLKLGGADPNGSAMTALQKQLDLLHTRDDLLQGQAQLRYGPVHDKLNDIANPTTEMDPSTAIAGAEKWATVKAHLQKEVDSLTLAEHRQALADREARDATAAATRALQDEQTQLEKSSAAMATWGTQTATSVTQMVGAFGRVNEMGTIWNGVFGDIHGPGHQAGPGTNLQDTLFQQFWPQVVGRMNTRVETWWSIELQPRFTQKLQAPISTFLTHDLLGTFSSGGTADGNGYIDALIAALESGRSRVQHALNDLPTSAGGGNGGGGSSGSGGSATNGGATTTTTNHTATVTQTFIGYPADVAAATKDATKQALAAAGYGRIF
jgi:hypothetical protein